MSFVTVSWLQASWSSRRQRRVRRTV